MKIAKQIIRISIWASTVFCLVLAFFLYFYGDINKIKTRIEKNLKEKLNCTIKLGELEWDFEGLKVGVSTKEISIFDPQDNLVLQAGPSRAVWHLENIIRGNYAHFHTIQATDLFLNAIRHKNKKWNFIEMFPPGPAPEADNLKLNNCIIHLIDELNPLERSILYKDFNIIFKKKSFSKIREINLTTRVGSFTSLPFLHVKGEYTESKKFNWKKNKIDLNIVAKNIKLADWEPYLTSWPQIKKIDGNFTGNIHIKKDKGQKFIKLKTKSKTSNLIAELQNKEAIQTIKIPKTRLALNAIIDEKKIHLDHFKSSIDKLSYNIKGIILNWSRPLPEIDLYLRTNKFNFKAVKPYLPLNLLPPDTRARIEPINDDGFIKLDLNLKGPAIAPKYFGEILLTDFNLTPESGFLNVIHGLEGKLVLNDEILKIDYLKIPVEKSQLTLNGEIDNKTYKTSFNLKGKELNANFLQDLISQAIPQSAILKEIYSEGKLDLDLNVLSVPNIPPEIKGEINFHNLALDIFQEEPVSIKNISGKLILDGAKVAFSKLAGLIDNENFFINGELSLKEDETINLTLEAKYLKIIPYIVSFISSKTPFRPIAETITGEANNLDLNITGTFSKPLLDGALDVNNISFNIPNLQSSISGLSGKLRFDKTELVVEELNGKLQDTDFFIAGYINNLFTSPKPKLRLLTNELEVSNLWNYLKEGLKESPLSQQIEQVKKLSGTAALDLFIQDNLVSGNIFFKDGNIKYEPLPFEINSLSGRLVIGEKNISAFELMGQINGSNDFTSNINIFNYPELDKSNIQGQVTLDLNPPLLVNAVNPELSEILSSDGLIPTAVNFDITLPKANFSFLSTLDENLMLDLKPYLSKPVGKPYTISGDFTLDTEKMDIYLKGINITTKKLSLTTTGSIKNILSKNPDLMLYFVTDEPSGIYMITEPIVPIMNLKVSGMINLSGSLSGTPAMFAVSSSATLEDIKMKLPQFPDKELTATDGVASVYFDNEQGILNTEIKNVNYVSLKAKDISLSLNYLNPVFYLNQLALDGDPGNIYATGLYNPEDGQLSFSANGSNLDLSNLGTFIFLDPTKLSGKTNFSVMIDTKGKLKDEIFKNTNGDLSFSVTEGQLGQVALLQKGLQLANLFSQGVFGFNLRNIFSLFFKYEDGTFNDINGELDIKNGVVNTDKLHYRAKNLFINTFGFIDLTKSLIGLSFYGFLPQEKTKEETTTYKGPLSVVPESFGKKRFFIPLISLTPPQHFKFEVKGDLKNQKKITSRARHSFKWLRKRQLQKVWELVPREED